MGTFTEVKKATGKMWTCRFCGRVGPPSEMQRIRRKGRQGWRTTNCCLRCYDGGKSGRGKVRTDIVVKFVGNSQSTAEQRALYNLLVELKKKESSSWEDFDPEPLILAEEYAEEVLARVGIVFNDEAPAVPIRAGKASEASDWCDNTLVGFHKR